MGLSIQLIEDNRWYLLIFKCRIYHNNLCYQIAAFKTKNLIVLKKLSY